MSNVPPPPPGPYYAAPQPMSPSDEKMWSVLVHIGGIFLEFFAALIGYLLLKDRGPFVRAHTATALNFQLTLLIAFVVGGVLAIVGIGVLIIIAAAVLNVVFSVIAAVKAGNGEFYQYPMSIKFFS
ncbi:DUF4870 domain-containing protein [Microbacterium sp. ARD32]|uniref:DUF4870 domain-containing protein n=1 Tax=Microbacterium sp. ARD32 TaxID=2962577 RepID=UPI002880D7E2|nr:DUF4870 domain-containing protein [Microbacterium sp. ARD32]MDT0158047.1 DUF4870 domain-containing protein [Microbacterium sp. ARD32]